ncbi:MND1-interacting protein 1-like [Quillaja saponaria]|uniref:MND1-interacting protein 1-like n=1 Tax=Quillaja saponaria TaxID=32244 RepID=A0AAD7PCP1_QUISA|nr:MND1-interacting protein 1-like [Quillaja saponaria]
MAGSQNRKKSKRKSRVQKPKEDCNRHRFSGSNPEYAQRECDKNSGLGQEQCDNHHAPDQIQFHPNTKVGETQHVKPSGNIGPADGMQCHYTNQLVDGTSRKCYSDQQLEKLLLRKLERVYDDVYANLKSYGYSDNRVLSAILTNGHAHGYMDTFSNIKHNSLSYIKSGIHEDLSGELLQVSDIMKKFVKNTLKEKISMLCNIRPQLKKGDAMQCLLASDFNLRIAVAMDVPYLTNEGDSDGDEDNNPIDGSSSDHGVQGDHHSGTSDIYDSRKYVSIGKSGVLVNRESRVLKSLNLTPYLKSKLRNNIRKYADAFLSKLEVPPEPVEVSEKLMEGEKEIEEYELEESCMADLVLNGFQRLLLEESLEEDSDDPQVAIVSRLVNHIKDVKQQVKKCKEWAHEKVIQSANKLSSDLLGLKNLKIEKEETEKVINGKILIEEENLKRSTELESSLRNVACQTDAKNATVRRLQHYNAEIRSDVEAFKLRAADSENKCSEVGRKEKKILMRITTLEKQNQQFQEEIEKEKKNFQENHQKLIDLRKYQEAIKLMYVQEVKEKELAITQLQEELRLTKEARVILAGREEALCCKIEIDNQRYKDEIHRLEQEISCFQTCLDSTYNLSGGELHSESQRETLELMLPDVTDLTELAKEDISNRACLICRENESNILFLPCAHQVLCASCSGSFSDNVQSNCPCCDKPIAQRVLVYGGSL